MVPSAFHVPPERISAVLLTTRTGPPEYSTRLSLPSAKKAISRLSADQNGLIAPSVPGNSRGSGEPSERTQSRRGETPVFVATNATCRPSGDTTGNGAVATVPTVKNVLSGGSIENCTGGASVGWTR